MTEMDDINSAVDTLAALNIFDLVSNASVRGQLDTISDLLDLLTDNDINGYDVSTARAELIKARDTIIVLINWLEAIDYLKQANGSLPAQ